MLNFPVRSSQPEILDDFDLQGNDLTENLKELEKVNALLGGNAIVKEGIGKLISHRTSAEGTVTIVDAGCGGGDTLRMLASWAYQEDIELKLIGVDANREAIRYAENHASAFKNISFQQLNILSPQFSELKADIVMFNLFLHHFEEEQITGFLRACRSNGSAVMINDLQRSKLAYHAFRLVSRMLGFSYIGRHDGKLSVRKSFTKKDWHRIMAQAGITNYQIHWRWAFRYLVLVE